MSKPSESPLNEIQPHGIEEPEGSGGAWLVFALTLLIFGVVGWIFQDELSKMAYEKFNIGSAPAPIEVQENDKNYTVIQGREKTVYPKVEVTEPEPEPENTRLKIFVRLKDGNEIQAEYYIFPAIIEVRDEWKTKDIVRQYFSQFTTEQVYQNINEHAKALKKLIEVIEKIEKAHIEGVFFNQRTMQMIEANRIALQEVERAKIEVELAKQEALLKEEYHRARMDQLKMERIESLFKAETDKMVKEVNEKNKP